MCFFRKVLYKNSLLKCVWWAYYAPFAVLRYILASFPEIYRFQQAKPIRKLMIRIGFACWNRKIKAKLAHNFHVKLFLCFCGKSCLHLGRWLNANLQGQFVLRYGVFGLMFGYTLWVKKEEIWLSPMTKAPTPTEKSKKQRDNTKTPPKTSITQGLRTDLGRSAGATST